MIEQPPRTVVTATAHALARNAPAEPVYARIDAVEADGTLLLMEAECIDPVLCFTESPPAADAFADEVLARTHGGVAAGR